MFRITFRGVTAFLALAVLSAGVGAGDVKAAPPTLDTFKYNFSNSGGEFKLSVSSAGNVSYTHNENRKEGFNTTKTFTIPEKNATELLSGLIEDGLLDLEANDQAGSAGAVNLGPTHSFHVTCGRWQLSLRPKVVPKNILDRLLPVLMKADPAVFKVAVVKVVKNPASVPDGKSIDYFSTTFDSIGKITILSVSRDGAISYLAITSTFIGRADTPNVSKYWNIPAKDAAALLDGLVADGLDREVLGGDEATKFAQHKTTLGYGRWYLETKRSLPAKAIERLIPLLEQGEK